MIDCYFIFPPVSVRERYGDREISNVEGHLPPLGLLSIAAMLERDGFTAKILDGPVSGMNSKEAADHVLKDNPRIVCISSITSTFYRAVEVAKRIKEISPDTPILTGGHHATIMPSDILKAGCFDIAVRYEGELSFLNLFRLFKEQPDILKHKERLKFIEGIYFKGDAGVPVFTSKQEPIQNLDELPFHAWHLVDMKKYKPLSNQYKRLPAINFVAVRGCMYHCSFCSNPAIFGHKPRMMSPKRVVDEIKYLKENYGIKEISFWDDVFTINRDWVIEICKLMIDENVDITWSCYSRANTVDPEMLSLMKKAGCWNIFFGLETGDQELLRNINKGTTPEIIRRGIKWTSAAGIETRGSFMLALPGETPEKARKTIAFACSLDIDYAQFCITTPFPGTKLWDEADEWGTLDKNFKDYHIWTPVFVPKGYKNKEEVEGIVKEAFRKFYMRPSYAWRRLSRIRSVDDVKRNINGLKMVLGFTEKEVK